jgi:CSLREA domain-containing protein
MNTRTLNLILASLVLLTLSASPSHADRSSTLTVTKLSDTDDGVCDDDCSLREALEAASPNSTISFAPKLNGKIKLRRTLIINKNVTIDGPNAKCITISGRKAVRVFLVEQDSHLTIKNLAISDGRAKGARGEDGEGGGLYNNGGIVTIINCIFAGNKAEGGKGEHNHNQGAGGNGRGGAVFAYVGTVHLINSTLTDNKAVGRRGSNGVRISSASSITVPDVGAGGHGMGGALFSTGRVFLVNSTFSHNRAVADHGGYSSETQKDPNIISHRIGQSGNGYGGAIYNSYDMQISNCTFTQNGVSSRKFGIGAAKQAGGVRGGAIYNGNRLKIKNTIVANSQAGGNCGGSGLMISEGYNLDSDGTCNLTGSGDLRKVDPKLKSLKNNGGATLTHALEFDSPAIGGGDPAGCTDHEEAIISTDQRGCKRPWGNRCDIGAFEFSR